MTKKKLPTISSPTLVTTLPVSGVKIKYRPFVIKEQKALLLAQESNDQDTVVETIKSVVSSCTDGEFDFSAIPTVDLAYFFIQLRIASVGPEVRFKINCTECDGDNLIGMSLNDISIDASKIQKTVKLTESIGLTIKYPTVDDVLKPTAGVDPNMYMLYAVLDYVYDDDTVYSKSDYTEVEFYEWLETLNDQQMSNLKSVLESLPSLSHTLNFNCTHCGKPNSRTLEGLHSFFRFGSNS